MKSFIIAAAALISGCSFYAHPGSQVPSEADPQTGFAPYECHASYAAPVADTLLAVGGGTLTGLAGYKAATSQVQSTGNAAQDQTNATKADAENWTLLGGAALITAIYAGSAIYGYSKVSQCETHMDRSQARANHLRVQYAREVVRQQEFAAQQEATRQVEAKRLAEVARQEAARLAAAEAARIQAERDTCAQSLPDRLLADKELKHHIGVQAYVDAACKVIPITKQQCSNTGLFGDAVCTNVVVGKRLTCSGERPVKLDGSKITDVDVLAKNYTTDHDDVPGWEKLVLSSKACTTYDREPR